MSKRPAGHRKKERPVGRRTTEPIGKQPAEHHKMERQPEPHRQERPAAGHRKMPMPSTERRVRAHGASRSFLKRALLFFLIIL